MTQSPIQTGFCQNQSPQMLSLKEYMLDFCTKLDLELQQLTKNILNMAQQHVGEYIIVYSRHIESIKRSMRMMNTKMQQDPNRQHEPYDEITQLKKQIVLYRQQSMKWYDKFQQNKEVIINYKNKIQYSQNIIDMLKKQIKQLSKSKKQIQIALNQAQTLIFQLQTKINKKQQQIKTITIKSKSIHLIQHAKTQQRDHINDMIDNKTKGLSQFSKKQKYIDKLIRKRGGCQSVMYKDNELKLWFYDCIKSIKKQIAARKINSIRNNDINQICNIEQFKLHDKIKLMQKFIQNQKLLVWMYQKIFPSRINQINQYLTKKHKTQPQYLKNEDSGQNNIKEIKIQDEKEEGNGYENKREGQLPKIVSDKRRNRKVKNFVLIASGKLQFSRQKQ